MEAWKKFRVMVVSADLQRYRQLLLDAPRPGQLLPSSFQAAVGQSVRDSPEGLRPCLSGKHIPAQQRLLALVIIPRRFARYVIPGPESEDVVLPFRAYMIPCRAGTVERLTKQLQELFLVSQGQSKWLLKDFSNQLQPRPILRVIAGHASILNLRALGRHKKMLPVRALTALIQMYVEVRIEPTGPPS